MATGARLPFDPLGTRNSLDAEGLVLSPLGGFWVSDEYGPNIYYFSPSGRMLSAIAPPAAFIPRRNGTISFSSDNPPIFNESEIINPENPDSGRANNQGFEGLTLSPDGRTLSVLLQTSLVQDGGDNDATRNYPRLLTYDVTIPLLPRLTSAIHDIA